MCVLALLIGCLCIFCTRTYFFLSSVQGNSLNVYSFRLCCETFEIDPNSNGRIINTTRCVVVVALTSVRPARYANSSFLCVLLYPSGTTGKTHHWRLKEITCTM